MLGGVTIEDNLHIFPKILGGMLISWRSAQRLRIPQKNNPTQMLSVTDKTSPNKVTANNLIREFPQVLDGNARVMKGKSFKILLKDETQSFCVTAPRTIPFAYMDKVKDESDTLQSQGNFDPISDPTEWCAPIAGAPKKNSDNIRICVDFSKLNKLVKREFYSMCTPSDVVADISEQHSKCFTVFDALKVYHQCPLDEQSQLLITFMTPFGRYKFLRAPFGICSISQRYNRRMDEAFQGLKSYRRFVDDIIIFHEDKNTHVAYVRKFLKRCAEKRISLHKKFKFGVTSITFAGYNLSSDGYKVDSSLLKGGESSSQFR